MTSRTIRIVAGAATALWLIVAGYAVRELVIADGGDDWELAYAVLATALPIGVALTICVLGSATRGSRRSRLRLAGLGVSVLGCAFAAIAAWALPIWMTLLAVGFGLTAAAATGRMRWPMSLLAVSSGCGVTTQLTLLRLGATEDIAANVALLLAALATVLVWGSSLRRFGEGLLAEARP